MLDEYVSTAGDIYEQFTDVKMAEISKNNVFRPLVLVLFYLVWWSCIRKRLHKK